MKTTMRPHYSTEYTLYDMEVGVEPARPVEDLALGDYLYTTGHGPDPSRPYVWRVIEYGRPKADADGLSWIRVKGVVICHGDGTPIPEESKYATATMLIPAGQGIERATVSPVSDLFLFTPVPIDRPTVGDLIACVDFNPDARALAGLVFRVDTVSQTPGDSGDTLTNLGCSAQYDMDGQRRGMGLALGGPSNRQVFLAHHRR